MWAFEVVEPTLNMEKSSNFPEIETKAKLRPTGR